MNGIRRLMALSMVLAGFAAGTPMSVSGANFDDRWLEVHVQDAQDGRPLAGAAVCLGTSARLDQFGARRSDETGTVRFREFLPNTMMLTVSHPGFRGRQQVLEPLYENRILVVRLAHGGGGPQCRAPVASGSGHPAAAGLAIEEVTVKSDPSSAGGDHRVLLSVRLSGTANQIRVSEQRDFADVSWQPLRGSVAYQLSDGKGLKQIFVQVRRVANTEGAAIEVVSPVKRVQYRAR
ncbi:MAG TPA: carboxypeptidase regulatory-like domain-containing protein [Gammaproteobacteria bacterium]|nr:carboxypeptidase regulatory-like domain-containing protein [Gammaproteobacteria bacterium]